MVLVLVLRRVVKRILLLVGEIEARSRWGMLGV